MPIVLTAWYFAILTQQYGTRVIFVKLGRMCWISLFSQEITYPEDLQQHIIDTHWFSFSWALILCLLVVAYTATFPNEIFIPVWLFMSWWVPNDASTHHSACPKHKLLVRGRTCVTWRYFITWFSFLRSLKSGDFTLLLKCKRGLPYICPVCSPSGT